MCYDLITSPHAMCAYVYVLRLASPFATSPLLLSDCKSTHFSVIIDHSPLSRDDDDDKSTMISLQQSRLCYSINHMANVACMVVSYAHDSDGHWGRGVGVCMPQPAFQQASIHQTSWQ
jgi:hypothetical protein